MKQSKKPPVQDNPAVTATQPTPIIRIIKVATCPTLSGKGSLGYHIGCNAENEISIRVASNSGSGFFSPEWVPLKAIQDALEHGHKPLTSYAVHGLFSGKSANSPGFLFAALLAEGLVQHDEENPRVYVCCDPSAFIAAINQLLASEVNLKVDHIPAGRKTAPPVKKPKSSKSTPQNSNPSVHNG